MIQDVTMRKLEKRFYYLVIYQLTGIQKSLQADHAGKRYGRKYGNDPEYIDYVDNWETIITLDGGTTNDDDDSVFFGTLNQIEDELVVRAIKHSSFREPDLNNALTAIGFLADERVWNTEKFPDFVEDGNIESGNFQYGSYFYQYNSWSNERNNVDGQTYDAWVEYMGGENNLFLRELVRDKKLARG